MKKGFKTVLLFAMICLLALIFVACSNGGGQQPEHQHYFSVYFTNDAVHWQQCNCGEIQNYGEHTYDNWVIDTPATEGEEGAKHRSCTVCGWTQHETIPRLEHVHNWSDYMYHDEGHWQYCSGCGDVQNYGGHTYGDWEIDRQATEEAEGAKHRVCSVCGYTQNETIEKLAHTHTFADEWDSNDTHHWHNATCGHELTSDFGTHAFGDWEIDCPATEDEEGAKHRVCSVCGKVENGTIDRLEHTHTFNAVIFEPTCTNDGCTRYTCTKCDYSYLSDETPALGHNYEFSEIVWDGYTAKAIYICSRNAQHSQVFNAEITSEVTTAPTCTATGIRTYTATYDGHTATNEEVLSAIGHDLVHHDAHAPTCTEIGWAAYDTCSRCDYTTYQEIPALGHNYNAVVTAPTCTAQGYTTHTCSRCGDSYVDSYVNALGHNEVADVGYDSTCEHTGLTDGSHCSRCGLVIVAQQTIPLKAHNYGDWATIQPATCLENGIQQKFCLECGKTFTGIIPALGHSYNAVVTPPTCTAQGYTTHTCERCGNSYADSYVDALGHDYEFSEFLWNGYTAKAVYVCSHDAQHTQKFNAEITSEVTTAPTCTSTGIRIYTATYDEHTATKEEVLSALGHDLVHHGAQAPTCTEIGWAAYDTCSRCDYTTYEEIPALGHNYEFSEFVWNGYTAKAVYVCSHNAEHTQEFNAEITSEVTTAPTCTSTGIRTYTATYDEHTATKEEVLSALGHDLVHHNAQEPTCTEIGWAAYDTCSRCDYTTYEEIPALGHNYEFSEFVWDGYTAKAVYVCSHNAEHTQEFNAEIISEVTTAPTCTTTGIRTYTATYDEHVDTKEEVLPALGHNYEFSEFVWNGYTAKAVYVCSRNAEHTQEFNAEITSEVITAPTCTTSGMRRYTATYDEHTATKEEVLSALGHNYDENNLCTRCGDHKYLTFTFDANANEYAVTGFKNSPKSLVIPQTYKGYPVTSIGAQAFYNCGGLTSVTIPNSVTSMGGGAFRGCSSLVSMTIPFVGGSATATEASDSTLFGYIFGTNSYTGGTETKQYYENGSSKTYYIPSALCSVTVTGGNIWYGSFYGCSMLTSITILDSVTSIELRAFYGCSNIATINYLGDIASWCAISGLNYLMSTSGTLYINGEELTGDLVIPSGVTSIGDYAFRGCTRLTSVTIPNSVTSIGSHAFRACTGLTSVTIPDSVTSIGSHAFRACTGLTSITIPDSITSIGGDAFSGCSNLATINYLGDIASWCAISGLDQLMSTSRTLYMNGEELTGDLVIPSGVATISAYAFYYCSGLTSITIPDSVTSIGSNAFSGCTGLTSITGNATIPATVASQCGASSFSVTITSGTSIGGFSYCTGLKSITIPASVTSIGKGAFKGCSSLESMTIPFVGADAGKTSSDTYQYPFGYIFGTDSYTGGRAVSQTYYGSSTSSTTSTTYYIPSSLRSVTVTGGNILRGAFYDCRGLTSITIPNSVTSIGSYAFYYCSGLTSITIPDSVTSIGSYAFNMCTGLTSVTIGNSVTSMGSSAFSGCSNLAIINYTGDIAGWCGISGLNNILTSSRTLYIDGNLVEGDLVIPNGVTSISAYAFANRTGLTSITFGENSQLISIGDYAFDGCTGLTSVTIGNNVTSIGSSSFSGCYKLVEVYNKSSLSITAGSSDNGWVGYYAKNVYAEEGGSKLSTDENGYIVYTDGEDRILVGYTGNSTNLTLPSNITEIYQYAFYNCSGITSITIPDSVTSIGGSAFYNCSGLTSITIPSGVTSIGASAFRGCTGLTSITIPDSVTSIGDSAFYGCSNLATINYLGDIASWCAISGLSNLMYYGTSSKSLYINGVLIEGDLVIPSGVTSIGRYAFYGCSGLTSVTIPDSVTNIGGGAFLECSGLTSVTIGNSVTSIGSAAFRGCSGLTSVTIGNSVTSIGNLAFCGCSGLTSITIPDSVTSIVSYAFSGCSGLTSINYDGTMDEWNAISKGSNWNDGTGDYTIHCTDGDVAKS